MFLGDLKEARADDIAGFFKPDLGRSEAETHKTDQVCGMHHNTSRNEPRRPTSIFCNARTSERYLVREEF